MSLEAYLSVCGALTYEEVPIETVSNGEASAAQSEILAMLEMIVPPPEVAEWHDNLLSALPITIGILDRQPADEPMSSETALAVALILDTEEAEANLPDEIRELMVEAGCIEYALGEQPDDDPGLDSPDRDALVAFYEATDGPNWTDNTNWLSDAPVWEWHGVATDDSGRVMELHLHGNQLSGTIPPELGSLANLIWLDLESNYLSGQIPPELGNLANLVWLNLRDNQLSGQIPPELGDIPIQEALLLSGNQFTDCIPESLQDMTGHDFPDLGLPFCDDAAQTPTPAPSLDRAALVALYNATNGPNWTNHANWLSDRPIGE